MSPLDRESPSPPLSYPPSPAMEETGELTVTSPHLAPTPRQRLQRRRSFFARRPGSAASGSTVSGHRSGQSSLASIEPLPSLRLTSDGCSSHATSSWASDELPPPPRNLFTLGTKQLKKHASKLSLSSITTGNEDVEESEGWKAAQERVWKQAREEERRPARRSRKPDPVQKRNISAPFDFQHITHTSRNQFPELRNLPSNQLSSEFYAARAAQFPRRELQGINAQDLHATSERSDSAKMSERRPLSAEATPEARPSRPARHVPGGSCSAIDVAQLSRPGTSMGAGAPSRPSLPKFHLPNVVPPPRTSSINGKKRRSERQSAVKGVTAVFDDERPLTSAGFCRPMPLDAMIASSNPPPIPSSVTEVAAVAASAASFMPHAVTTPDNTAQPLKAPILPALPGLPGVEEEPESSMPAAQSRISSGSTLSQRMVRHARSVPDLKRASRRQPSQSSVAPMAEGETRAGSTGPSSASTLSNHRRSSSRPSVASSATDRAWEDDIDYCYDHAAEANCDYQWERHSIGKSPIQEVSAEGDEAEEVPDTEAATVPDSPTLQYPRPYEASPANASGAAPSAARLARTRGPPLVVPSFPPSAAADSSPAGSSAAYGPEAITPSDSLNLAHPPTVRRASFAAAYGEPDDFTHAVPAPHLAAQMLQDSMYREILGEKEQKESSFSFFDATAELPERVSYRSSDTPLSKCESYESFDFGQGVSITPAPGHDSINSNSSVPALVHSQLREEETEGAEGESVDEVTSLKLVNGLNEYRHSVSSSTSRLSRANSDAAAKALRSIARSRESTARSRVRSMSLVNSPLIGQTDAHADTFPLSFPAEVMQAPAGRGSV
ncbi:MAG: hypothetical protein M1838_004798 [Thelocarpon superellum]|nr:MAG: hypothetical protein M1838_004798 [Thelocarpon superellum]